MKKIKLLKKELIKHPKGNIIKLINSKTNINLPIKESYLSEIFPKKIKAWKMHKKQDQVIFVLVGSVNFFIYSENNNKINSFTLDNNKKFNGIIIPKKIWYGFGCNSKKKATVINFLTSYYRKNDCFKLNIKNSIIKDKINI
jgi:dTDP-4-dehydrorhamnose 3,5-epimerase